MALAILDRSPEKGNEYLPGLKEDVTEMTRLTDDLLQLAREDLLAKTTVAGPTNVAAAVSLAGLGLDQTIVCVVADPSIERSTHEVVAEGEFGRLRFSIEGIPTPENRRTGRLVAMSVVHALRRRTAPLVIG